MAKIEVAPIPISRVLFGDVFVSVTPDVGTIAVADGETLGAISPLGSGSPLKPTA